jgi:hypothetical protein
MIAAPVVTLGEIDQLAADARRTSEGCQWHCQLKRPWYARRVGGAAARVGELLCSPIMLPRPSRAEPQKVALGALS